MKKLLLLSVLLPSITYAQFSYFGPVFDSTTFTFSNTDSLDHVYYARIDTASSVLWKIGNTLKPVFSNDTISARGIMTDTLHSYPPNANDYFGLKIFSADNCIVDFWHKYQTDSLHAGGIVEFSTDSATWMNIAYCPGIETDNFYSATDTLFTGQPAFTGLRSGEELSRFQLMDCMALKTTATSCFPDLGYGVGAIYIRFRFVSDTTVDSLSGWMIDSVKVEFTGCGEGVKEINRDNNIALYPNPAFTQITVSASENITSVDVYDLLGQLLKSVHCHSPEGKIDVADLPPGMYLIKINGTEVRKFVKE